MNKEIRILIRTDKDINKQIVQCLFFHLLNILTQLEDNKKIIKLDLKVKKEN